MKILFIVDFNHFLLNSLYSQLRDKNIFVKELAISAAINNKKKGRFWNLIYKTKKMINVVKIIFYVVFNGKKFNVISYHYATDVTRYIDKIIHGYSRRRVVTIWGSEFLRCSRAKKDKLLRFYQEIDVVSVTNPGFLPLINKYQINAISLSFGLAVISSIKELKKSMSQEMAKKMLNLNPNKKTIVIGTNAAEGQQHLKVIEQIRIIDKDIESTYELIFPLTYGNTNIAKDITKAIANLTTKSKLLFNPMSDIEIAALRIATDILIQVQETDQLSGAMLETLYAGGYVITGAWLPYKILDAMGINWSRIASIQEIALLIKSINNINKLSLVRNSQIIESHYSWPTLIDDWIEFFVGEVKC